MEVEKITGWVVKTDLTGVLFVEGEREIRPYDAADRDIHLFDVRRPGHKAVRFESRRNIFATEGEALYENLRRLVAKKQELEAQMEKIDDKIRLVYPRAKKVGALNER